MRYGSLNVRAVDLPVLGIAFVLKKVFGGRTNQYLLRDVILTSRDGFRYAMRRGGRGRLVDDRVGFADVFDDEPRVLEILTAGVPPGGVFVDVGAGIGRYTVRIGARAGRVYAVEPNGDNFAGLVRNVNLNGLDRRVVPSHCAAWSSTTTLKISNQGARSALGSTGEDVEALPLSSIVHGAADAMKVDTEGAEVEVLKGLGELRPNTVVVEVHGKGNLKEVERILGGYGYVVVSEWPRKDDTFVHGSLRRT